MLVEMKKRHIAHHFHDENGNFGITTYLLGQGVRHLLRPPRAPGEELHGLQPRLYAGDGRALSLGRADVRRRRHRPSPAPRKGLGTPPSSDRRHGPGHKRASRRSAPESARNLAGSVPGSPPHIPRPGCFPVRPLPLPEAPMNAPAMPAAASAVQIRRVLSRADKKAFVELAYRLNARRSELGAAAQGRGQRPDHARQESLVRACRGRPVPRRARRPRRRPDLGAGRPARARAYGRRGSASGACSRRRTRRWRTPCSPPPRTGCAARA